MVSLNNSQTFLHYAYFWCVFIGEVFEMSTSAVYVGKKNLQLYSKHNSGWLQPEAKMII